MKTLLSLIAGVALGAAGVLGWQHLTAMHGGSHQQYAGQQDRTVSSLSASDVEQLLAGHGWGLAKPAEFNGYPGPRHVLDVASELELTDAQKQRIQAAFETMSKKARELGKAYVEAERALDEAFKSGGVTKQLLQERLEQAQALKARLREAHLAAHLEISPLLTQTQIRKYAQLRGYGEHGHQSGHSH